jgi:MATE family multidrug resistance protein
VLLRWHFSSSLLNPHCDNLTGKLSMTQPNSHQRIWQLAWPMILSNLSVPLLGAVDTAILGHLDSPGYLGAVAIGASVLSLLYWSFGFLRMGTTSLVARACGREDQDGARLLLAQSILLGALLGALLLALQALIIPLAVHLMNPTGEVAALARSYLHIRLFSAPATLINFALIGWFIGQQDTRGPLLILVATNLLNIILDWLLIVVLGLNSDGAALASVIAEYTGLALALWLVRSKLMQLGGRMPWPHLGQVSAYLPLLQVNRHLFVRTLCLLGVFVFFTAQGARQGETILAANAILLQFLLLASHGLDGFAHAAEALTGKAIGSRNLREFFQVCRATTLWALIVALLMTLVFALGRPLLLPLFSNIDEVLALGYSYYLWVCLLPLIGVWAYQLDGIFLGSGKTAAMQYTMLIAVVLVFAPLWWLTRHWGNHGLWLSFSLFNLSRGLLMGACFGYYTCREKWQESH